MEQTVIGIFDSASEANDAKRELISNGFSEYEVDVASGSPSANFGDSSDSNRDTHETGIAHFFRNLFGSDEDESERYTRVAEKGHVVTVHVHSGDEAKRAASLLDDYGAVDVDENYRKYKNSDDDSNWGNRPGTMGAGVAGSSANTSGVGTGSVAFGSSAGDTYVDTDLTTSGMVRDEALDADINTGAGGGIFDDGSATRSTPDSDNDGGIFNRSSNRNNDRGLFDGDRDTNRRNDTDESRKIPVIEENLKVGKQEVETGGVRVRSRIVEKPVEEHLRLREEHVRVDRNAVDREATSADMDAFKEETIELRERAEVPVVSKEARVVEEVSLDKSVEHRDETINDTVRSTELDIEELKGENKRDN